MGRLSILLILLTTICNAAKAEESTSEQDDFVVMTWNLEWFFDSNKYDNRSSLAKEQSAPSRAAWDWRRDAVAASLASVAPHVIALQEAEGTKTLGYLKAAIQDNHDLKYRVTCMDGAEPFTEQDVAFVYSDDTWLQGIAHRGQSRAMYRSKEYYNVFKHIEATFEVGPAKASETITILNVHLRARAEKEDIRIRQARLVHAWIAERVKRGENVIVLGDFNSEEPADQTREDSDVGIICGLHTEDKDDDLVDLHSWLPEDQRQTHLLEGKAFDRIVVSRSLLEDDPDRLDLVFRTIERPRELSVKGKGPDEQETHWNAYWEMDERERDLSDHWPIVARFKMQ